MFNIIITENYDQVSTEAFMIMKKTMKLENPVLGLATGSSPIGLYKKMIADRNTNGTSYRNAVTYNLDEYIGLPRYHDQSYWTFMHENLFDGLNIPEVNIHIPRGDAEDIEEECRRYEEELQNTVIDLQILGIGSDGHIGFNEPGTPFDSLTHVAELTQQTRADNARFFDDDIEKVPAKAITMGLATILRANQIIVLATGANKADAVYGMIKGPKKEICPASILQGHGNVTVIVDRAAAARL